jgi:nucleoid-associated protein YgaU
MAAAKKKRTQTKKIATSTRATKETRSPQAQNRFFDYFRFSESYTSLILGIVVVIITSILLMSVVKNRNIGKDDQPIQQISATRTVVHNNTGSNPAINEQQQPTLPKQIIAVSQQPSGTAEPTVTQEPTQRPTATLTPTRVPTNTPTPTTRPTAVASKQPTATKAPTVTKAQPTATPSPTVAPTKAPTQQPITGDSYTVKAGDDLWKIAQAKYKNGYLWSEIAKANKLDNPGVLYVGSKLTLPRLDQKVIAQYPTPEPTQDQAQVQGEKISGTVYTIKAGDTLWDISVRAYNGNGYRWSDIAKANNLTDPNVILVGSTLKLPRS